MKGPFPLGESFVFSPFGQMGGEKTLMQLKVELEVSISRKKAGREQIKQEEKAVVGYCKSET